MIQRRLRFNNFPMHVLLIYASLLFVEAVSSQTLDSTLKDISKDSTFDVVTWNIEWFGSSTK